MHGPSTAIASFAVTLSGLLAACDTGVETTNPPAGTVRPTQVLAATPFISPTPGAPAPLLCSEAITAALCTDTSGMEAAAVARIVDGDTLDIVTAGRKERVRIFGVDAPERGDRCYAEASVLLRNLAGSEIRMRSDLRKVDRNGRLLRYVYRPDGLSIDAELIAQGVATAWTRDGALRDSLVMLEAEARLRGNGCLWH
jgi:micrococcal nuclease